MTDSSFGFAYQRQIIDFLPVPLLRRNWHPKYSTSVCNISCLDKSLYVPSCLKWRTETNFCLISRGFSSAGSTSLFLYFLKLCSNTALWDLKSPCSLSRPGSHLPHQWHKGVGRCLVNTACIAQHGVCDSVGAVVLVTVMWQWNRYVYISNCLFWCTQCFYFSTCLWKLSSPLIFQYRDIRSPTYYINRLM